MLLSASVARIHFLAEGNAEATVLNPCDCAIDPADITQADADRGARDNPQRAFGHHAAIGEVAYLDAERLVLPSRRRSAIRNMLSRDM